MPVLPVVALYALVEAFWSIPFMPVRARRRGAESFAPVKPYGVPKTTQS